MHEVVGGWGGFDDDAQLGAQSRAAPGQIFFSRFTVLIPVHHRYSSTDRTVTGANGRRPFSFHALDCLALIPCRSTQPAHANLGPRGRTATDGTQPQCEHFLSATFGVSQ
jgi:hypothetical protein